MNAFGSYAGGAPPPPPATLFFIFSETSHGAGRRSAPNHPSDFGAAELDADVGPERFALSLLEVDLATEAVGGAERIHLDIPEAQHLGKYGAS